MLKTPDAFQFDAQPELDRDAILQLCSGAFVTEAANVVLVGGVGTGKTHLAIALGMACCQHDYRVRFLTAAELTTLLVEAQQQGRLARKLDQLARFDVVIVDELGYVPFDKAGADLGAVQQRDRTLQGWAPFSPERDAVGPEISGVRADVQEQPDRAADGRRQGRVRFQPEGEERRRGDAFLLFDDDRAGASHRRRLDIPAGDIGVGALEISYLFGQYKRINNRFTGMLVGRCARVFLVGLMARSARRRSVEMRLHR